VLFLVALNALIVSIRFQVSISGIRFPLYDDLGALFWFRCLPTILGIGWEGSDAQV